MSRSRVFLSGPMGSGKSTVARLLGAALGVQTLDLDRRIEEHSGVSVAELFRLRGEIGFRAIEAEVLTALLADPTTEAAVIALGGGTLVPRALRHAVLAAGVVLTLDAAPEVLAQRIGRDAARPLLAGRDPVEALTAICAQRREVYAECDARIDTAERTPEEVVARALAFVGATRVVVPLGARTYGVEIGEGLRTQLPARVAEHARGARVLVTDATVDALWGPETRVSLAHETCALIDVVLPPGERAKTLSSVAEVWDAALGAGIDRDAIVIALGGGVIGDMAGFAASTLLRGVAFAQLPTTLLAMVDSSVGGKTGVNRAEGKNLIGTLYQPRFVLCDVGFLATLPIEERRAGLGEVVKCALLAGERELEALERDAPLLSAGESAATIRAITMAVALKARIVAADEDETRGLRLSLNLGHTLGHALEAESGYTLRHGEAVALGLLAALRVGEGLALTRRELRARVTDLLTTLGLPTDVDARIGPSTLRWVGQDKKRVAGKVRFVVPIAPGDARIVPLGAAELERLCRS